MFELGPRASYKISRLKVIFVAPWGAVFLLLFLLPEKVQIN